VIVLVRFASIVGWASLAAVFALIANAIALAVRDRIRDHAILQTLGWTGADIAWMVVMEASMLGATGGAIGAIGAHTAIALTHLNFTMEGVSIEVTASNAATLAGVLLATLLGAVAGVVPALSAARREIVQGFRTT
jgi:putative ABC transport system permease protein